MDVLRISTWDDLSNLRTAWNALADGVPFRSWDWLATWWKHYGGRNSRERELFVLAVYDENPQDRDGERRLIGLAPWMLRRSATMGTAIEFLGEEEACTDHLTILCESSNYNGVAAVLAEYLATEFRDWDVLNLYGIDEDDAMASELFDAMDEHGFEQPSKRPAFQTWQINLPGNMDDYMRMLSKSHRTHMRRALRRMEATSGIHRIVQTREELDSAWPILVDLHQKRWLNRDEPGCFASTRFTDSHRDIASLLLESGNLRLSVVEVAGQPVAVEYNLASRDTTYLYQSGLDPEQLAIEPGRLAMFASIEKAIGEGHTTFDFLRGDEPYKPHWRAQPAQAWHFRVINRRTSARLRDAGWRATQGAKQWIKERVVVGSSQ